MLRGHGSAHRKGASEELSYCLPEMVCQQRFVFQPFSALEASENIQGYSLGLTGTYCHCRADESSVARERNVQFLDFVYLCISMRLNDV